MHYLAQWRMQVAAGLLRSTNASVAAIALDVGYESEAAFSRAFKRLVGAPPAAWRRGLATQGGSQEGSAQPAERPLRSASRGHGDEVGGGPYRAKS